MKGHKMSEKRTEYSFRPNTDEMETIWANRLDQDQLIENLTGYYKSDVTVGYLKINDIQGNSTKADAAILFSQIAQKVNMELVVESGLLEIRRPQTREELEEHAKYVLAGQIAHEAFVQYNKDNPDNA